MTNRERMNNSIRCPQGEQFHLMMSGTIGIDGNDAYILFFLKEYTLADFNNLLEQNTAIGTLLH